jgi:xanthine dehydrogenase large subunit
MNQASALVHVYTDGSVGVSTAAVEMGQGVNTRIAQVPQRIFSLPPEMIKIETTNTTRVANTSPSAASSTHDLNGRATKKACETILKRLKHLASEKLDLEDPNKIEIRDQLVYYDGSAQDMTWKELVSTAFFNRVDLSQHAYYATPEIYFDLEKEKGHPFAYHAYGVGIIESTMDCLRGTYTLDRVSVVHDFGESMNPNIDLGQMEGGIVQGCGWMTSEELRYDDSGRLESNSLSTYKIPDSQGAPKKIRVHFLEDVPNKMGLFKSKAIGEPPLMYGIGAYFSLKNAIENFNPTTGMKIFTPMTPERSLLGLYDQKSTNQSDETSRTESSRMVNAD